MAWIAAVLAFVVGWRFGVWREARRQRIARERAWARAVSPAIRTPWDPPLMTTLEDRAAAPLHVEERHSRVVRRLEVRARIRR